MKLVSINCEDLFLFVDQLAFVDPTVLNEKQWQTLSVSTVENKPLAKCKALARELLFLDPDIIACSEVGGIESLENFSKLFLADQYRALLIEGNSDRGIDIGYLVHRRLNWGFDLRTHRNRPIGYLYPHERLSQQTNLPEGSTARLTSQRFSRDVAELRILDQQSQDAVVAIVLCVHLKSARDPLGVDPFGRERREAEFRTLLTIYSEVRAETQQSVPVLVCGDFNGTVCGVKADPEFAELAHTDLISIMGLSSSKVHETTPTPDGPVSRFTWIGFNRFRPVSRKEIDFILLPKAFSHLVKQDQSGIHRYRNELGLPLPEPTTWDERARYPSDHLPVYVSLDLPKQT